MRPWRGSRGFTLLEVLVALAILGLAVVTILQLFSQGLRLLKLSGDYQRAVLLADRMTREPVLEAEGIESGREGEFSWERRVESYPVPEELNAPGVPPTRIFRLSVQVRWSGNRSVEVATLRTVREEMPR